MGGKIASSAAESTRDRREQPDGYEIWRAGLADLKHRAKIQPPHASLQDRRNPDPSIETRNLGGSEQTGE